MGFFAIIFVIVATNSGIGPLGIGLLSGVSVAVGIVLTQVMTQISIARGARLPIVISGLFMAVTGAIIFFSQARLNLYIACVFGFLPPSGGIFVSALIEGVLAHTDEIKRTKIFALDATLVTISGALGALFASVGSIVTFSTLGAQRFLIGSVVVLGIVIAFIALGSRDLAYSNLSDPTSKFEHQNHDPIGQNSADEISRSRTNIRLLTFLFATDAAGSGVIASTLIIYWLRVHFHASVTDLSLLYFLMELLSAASLPVALKISNRIGNLNTAVFTHIPSSILLIFVPFSPNISIAILLLLVRAMLSKMDIPTRRSFISSIVHPFDRRLAASRTSMGKQAGRSIGPAIGGFIYSSVGPFSSFLLGGVLKIIYDITLWRSFRSMTESQTLPPKG